MGESGLFGISLLASAIRLGALLGTAILGLLLYKPSRVQFFPWVSGAAAVGCASYAYMLVAFASVRETVLTFSGHSVEVAGVFLSWNLAMALAAAAYALLAAVVGAELFLLARRTEANSSDGVMSLVKKLHGRTHWLGALMLVCLIASHLLRYSTSHRWLM